MNRLEAEQNRLYPAAPEGRTRVLVLQCGAWEPLARIWQGVQAELQWPAPGIAVAGEQGFQLWFSLAEAVPFAEASHMGASLKQRYAAEARVATVVQGQQPPPLPLGADRWSAFVASDLAALFADETWLDLPPSVDAQADLLSRLASIPAAAWREARQQLQPASAAPAAAPVHQSDPRQFLLEIMNDRTVELALRIEAAKALLPYSGR